MKRLPLIGITLLLAFAGGTLLGRRGETHVVIATTPTDQVSILSNRSAQPTLSNTLKGFSLYDQELTIANALATADATVCRKLFILHQHDDALRKLIALRWAEVDPLRLAKFLEKDGRRWLRDSATREALFLSWTAKDADAAYQYASAFGHPDVRGEFLREVFGNLLYQDRAKLTEYLAHETDRALLYVRGSFKDSLMADLPAAGAFINELPDSLFRIHASELVANRWGEKDPQAALNFAQGVEPNLRDHMVARTLDGWRQNDPQAVLDYLAENPQAAGVQRGKVEAALAEQLGKSDPTAALQWVDQNLFGKPHADAIGNVIAAGAAEHPATAAQIASALPAGESKSAGLTLVAENWFASDPNAALAWAQSVTSPVERTAVLNGLNRAPVPRAQRLALQDQLRKQD